MARSKANQTLQASDWDAYWHENQTPWDLGGTTPALASWLEDYDLNGKTVLVPGCGRGHDAVAISQTGAKVTAVDYSAPALAAAQAAYPGSSVDWRRHDVTALPFVDAFDSVWEYTCFCALHPSQRGAYLAAIAKALKPGGIYLGMVFQSVNNPEAGPPFQIAPEAFRELLATHLQVALFETPTTRSTKARRGKEIWFTAKKSGA